SADQRRCKMLHSDAELVCSPAASNLLERRSEEPQADLFYRVDGECLGNGADRCHLIQVKAWCDQRLHQSIQCKAFHTGRRDAWRWDDLNWSGGCRGSAAAAATTCWLERAQERDCLTDGHTALHSLAQPRHHHHIALGIESIVVLAAPRGKDTVATLPGS